MRWLITVDSARTRKEARANGVRTSNTVSEEWLSGSRSSFDMMDVGDEKDECARREARDDGVDQASFVCQSVWNDRTVRRRRSLLDDTRHMEYRSGEGYVLCGNGKSKARTGKGEVLGVVRYQGSEEANRRNWCICRPALSLQGGQLGKLAGSLLWLLALYQVKEHRQVGPMINMAESIG